MTYTIKITDDSPFLAQSLLFYLKSLTKSQEYSFLEIYEEQDDELSKELDFRYEHYINHSDEFQDWDDIKHKYLKN